MLKINYLEIIKRAWYITWRNRYLWWFGLFLSLGSGGTGWNLNFPWYEKNGVKEFPIKEADFFNFLNTYTFWIILGLVLFLLLITALTILRIISQAGIIKSIFRIDNNEESSFTTNFNDGKKYFWKLLALGLILGIAILALVIVLTIPVIILFVFKQGVLAVITILMAFFILIPLLVLFAYVGKFSAYYLVLSDLSIFSSIECGYQLFRKNILQSVLMSLLFISLGVALGIGIIILIFSVAMPFAIIGLLSYFLFSKIGAIIVAIIGGLVAIIGIIFIQSVYQAFYQTSWYLFFKEISSVKIEDKEKQVSVVLEKYPRAENA